MLYCIPFHKVDCDGVKHTAQVVSAFATLAHDEAKSLAQAWRTSRANNAPESVSDVGAFEAVVMEKVASEAKLFTEES